MRLLNGTDWPYRKENVQARYFFVETFQNKERKKKRKTNGEKKKKNGWLWLIGKESGILCVDSSVGSEQGEP